MEDLDLEAVDADMSTAVETVTNMLNGFISLLPLIVIAVVVLVVFYIAARFVRFAVQRVVGRKADKHSLGVALGRLAFIAMVFAGGLVAISIIAPSIGAAELFQLLGVGSVAIGFAFRDILQNFLAGILILIRQPFTEGDWIRYEDFEGIVEEISTRSTKISTFDKRLIIIPNGEIFTNAVMVMTAQPYLRREYDFGVGYDTDIDEAIAAILDAVKGTENVLTDPAPDAGLVDLAGSSINIRARWWTDTMKSYATNYAVMKNVKEALDAKGIDIPFPIRTLQFDDPLPLERA
jgi:small conductance mechanosensitive channel